MKQSNLILVIILLVLLTLIAATSIALFVVTSSTASVSETSASVTVSPEPSDPPAPAGTTSAPVITEKPPVTTTPPPSVTTTPPPTTTTPPPVTTAPPPTTKPTPPVTTPPVTDDPSPAPLSGKIQGDKLGGMDIDAEYEVVENDPASKVAKVRFAVYVNSYAIGIGARSENYLIVSGQKTEAIYTPAIQVPSGSGLTRTLLYEAVLEISRTADGSIPFQVEFYWHYKGSYSGEYADWLTVKADLSIIP